MKDDEEGDGMIMMTKMVMMITIAFTIIKLIPPPLPNPSITIPTNDIKLIAYDKDIKRETVQPTSVSMAQ